EGVGGGGRLGESGRGGTLVGGAEGRSKVRARRCTRPGPNRGGQRQSRHRRPPSGAGGRAVSRVGRRLLPARAVVSCAWTPRRSEARARTEHGGRPALAGAERSDARPGARRWG